MEEKGIQVLLIKYTEGKCTEEEKALVESAYLFENTRHTDDLSKEDISDDLAAIFNELPRESKKRQLWPKLAAAACIFLALSAMFYIFTKSGTETKKPANYTNVILPGKNTAALTLASGEIIQLSGAKRGIVIQPNQIAYEDGTPVRGNIESGYETISTPNGGQYQIVLSDGSRIMINAATSLRFLSNFRGLATRTVELKGEAYFEVAKDKLHPFLVTGGDQTVEVLGTHFNIANYSDGHEIKTTLLEGAVKVSSLKAGVTRRLNPGQEASFSGNGINIKNVDVDDAVAWKNGYFMFNYETLEEVMIKISRWYDIEVRYEDPAIKSIVFFGTISKFESISKVLNMLERTKKVKFLIDGRVIKIKSLTN
ncbi:MAG: iron dicitrate transport regulator FecR [Mucilaginibacter sp.]|nr:iron dicitrate transport regulator FecR [Mucilaginibacter sp.]